jgi:hypothetical protein
MEEGASCLTLIDLDSSFRMKNSTMSDQQLSKSESHESVKRKREIRHLPCVLPAYFDLQRLFQQREQLEVPKIVDFPHASA